MMGFYSSMTVFGMEGLKVGGDFDEVQYRPPIRPNPLYRQYAQDDCKICDDCDGGGCNPVI